MRKTILLGGELEHDRLGASYRRAFEGLGHSVVTFDYQEEAEAIAPWLRTRLGHRLTRRSLHLRRRGSRRWNDRLRAVAEEVRPDLAFLAGCEFVMPATVARMRDVCGSVVLFYPDDPTPGNLNHRPELLQAGERADLCYVWSHRLAERMRRGRPGLEARYLPFAWDPAVFPPAVGDTKPEHDVVFIGGWDRHRERWLEPVAREFDLAIWGPPYWGTRTRRGSAIRRCWQGRALRGVRAAETIRRSKIVLNILREQNLPDGTNMRTFEVPGCGGFLLASRTTGATSVYPEGEAGAYFGDATELLEKIAHYLGHAGEREAVAARARALTEAGQRYVDRARTILASAVESAADA